MLNILDIKNSIVLVKVGFDLPSLEDFSRILDAQKTIKLLIKNGNKVVLLSHWGRPTNSQDKKYSLEHMLPLISDLLQENVEFLNQYSDFKEIQNRINQSKDKLILLENTRFEPDEQSKNVNLRVSLAKKYADLGNYFVDEAFSLSHRQEATNTEIKQFLPWTLGLSYQQEILELNKLKTQPHLPFVAIMAGSKLETKLPIISKMIPLCTRLIIGGKLCFTFIRAAKEMGLNKYLEVDFGNSEVEVDFLDQAKSLLEKYSEKIILPVDFVYGDNLAKKISSESPIEKYALDIGPKSILNFQTELSPAKTVFWNGTMGYYEREEFNLGNTEIGKFLAENPSIYKVLGGGDTTSSLPKEVLNKMNFVSMGGGASLTYLSK